MSWVCDFCSSSNDDSVVECFVCGQRRSEASIQEARRRAREEKERRVMEKILKYSSQTSKILFIVSVSVSTLTTTLMLVLMMINGNLSTIIESGIAIGKHFGVRISESFVGNTGAIIHCIADSALLSLSRNFCNTKDYSTGHLLVLGNNLSHISVCVSDSFLRLDNAFTGLLAVAVTNIQSMFEVIVLMIKNGVTQFANLKEKLVGLLNRAIEKKNLFS